MKKPFKETKLGKIVHKAKDFIPDAASIAVKAATNPAGAVGDVINLLTGVDNDIAKECLNELQLKRLEIISELEKVELQEVTKRWSSDLNSDSWLSKNVRPLTLLYLLLVFTILVIGDSVENSFEVKIGWVNLIESLLITVVVAYFGGRSYEKGRKIK